MEKIIISLALLFCSLCTYDQTKDTVPTFTYTGNDFSAEANKFVAKDSQLDVYMSNYLSKNYFYLHDSLCHTGIALLKFKIDAATYITDISCSETTPALLASALKKTLQKSEPYWKRGKGRASQWILQPVLYDYHTKCKTIQHDFYSLKGGIFRFDDNSKVNNVECLILDPLVMSSGVEEN